MHRFFIPEEWIAQDEVLVKGEPAHQIVNVLRLKPKEHIVVLDNSGWEYEVEIEEVSNELVEGKVVGKAFGRGEPKIKVTLYQALLKADKFEIILQKGVELGVSVFTPFVSERCVVREPRESKVTRWKRIIQEAAEQSGRTLLPVLESVVPFKAACGSASQPSILLWEEERSEGLSDVLKQPSVKNSPTCSIFVGPEGGFSSSEVEYAQSRGVVPVGLGRRILRAETAGLVVISAFLYEKNEFG